MGGLLLLQLRATRFDATPDVVDAGSIIVRWRWRRLDGGADRIGSCGSGIGGHRLRLRRHAGDTESAQLQRHLPAGAVEQRAARPHFQQPPAIGAFRGVAFAHALRRAAGTGLQDGHPQRRADQHAGEQVIERRGIAAGTALLRTGGHECARAAIVGEQRAGGRFGILRQRAQPVGAGCRWLWQPRGGRGSHLARVRTHAQQCRQPHQQRPAAQRGQQPGPRAGLQQAAGDALLSGHGHPPGWAAGSRTG